MARGRAAHVHVSITHRRIVLDITQGAQVRQQLKVEHTDTKSMNLAVALPPQSAQPIPVAYEATIETTYIDIWPPAWRRLRPLPAS
jgi:hypothetical protein